MRTEDWEILWPIAPEDHWTRLYISKITQWKQYIFDVLLSANITPNDRGSIACFQRSSSSCFLKGVLSGRVERSRREYIKGGSGGVEASFEPPKYRSSASLGKARNVQVASLIFEARCSIIMQQEASFGKNRKRQR